MSSFSEDVTSSIPATTSDGKIEVKFPDGGRGFINPGEEAQAEAEGIQLLSAADLQQEKDLANADENNLLAGAVSGLSGLTLGLSDQIIKRSGLMSEKEIKNLYEANPNITTAGEIAGTIAPAFITGGAALPAGIAEIAGKGAANLAGKALSKTTSNTIKKAITTGAGSAVEGSLYGLGSLVHEDALGDHEFNAENAFASMGKGALTGGLFGGTLGAGTEIGKAGIKAAAGKVGKGLSELIENEMGFLKHAGATKGDIKKIDAKSKLTVKGMNDFAMDLGAGFGDTAEEIALNGGITKGGSKTLKEAAVTSLDDLAANNEIAREGGQKIMSDVLSEGEEAYQKKLAEGTLEKHQQITGKDLAEIVRSDLKTKGRGDLYDAARPELERLAKDVEQVGAIVDPLTGKVTGYNPLSLEQIKEQSKLFAKEAGFGRVQPSRTQEIHQRLWGHMEDKIGSILNDVVGSGAGKKYQAGKDLLEKSFTLEKILEGGRSKGVNNRGFSLTQGLATVAGGSIGGLPGAAVGYGLRKVQQDYQDKVASFYLRKLEKFSNKGKIDISDAVDSFFKNTSRAGDVTRRGAIKFIVGDAVDADKEKDIKDIVSTYSQDPRLIVDNFVKNNPQLLNVAPKTAQAIQQRVLTAAQFLGSKVPKQDDSPFQDTPISRVEAQRFKNYVEAVENPYKVIDNIKSGYITPEGIETFKVVYPKMFTAIQQEMSTRLPEFKKISEKQKAELSKILGLDAKKAYTPQGFARLQQTSAIGVQQDLQRKQGKPMDASNRSQTSLEKVLSR